MQVILKSGKTIPAVPAYSHPRSKLKRFACWSPYSNVILDGRNGRHIPKDDIKEIIGRKMALKY